MCTQVAVKHQPSLPESAFRNLPQQTIFWSVWATRYIPSNGLWRRFTHYTWCLLCANFRDHCSRNEILTFDRLIHYLGRHALVFTGYIQCRWHCPSSIVCCFLYCVVFPPWCCFPPLYSISNLVFLSCVVFPFSAVFHLVLFSHRYLLFFHHVLSPHFVLPRVLPR